MKKRLLFILLVLSMLGVGNSCSDKEIAPAVPSGNKVQLQFNRPATRTVYDGAGNGSWCDSDKVAVWASNGASGKFIEFTASDASRGLFEGTVDEGYTVGGVAVYPSVIAAGFDGTKVTLTLPGEYTVTEQTTNLPLVGWFTTPEGPVTLDAVGSAIEISYANVPPDAVAMSFNASSPIAGNFTLAEGESIAASTATGSTVTVKFTAPANAENKVTFYVPVPAGDYTTASTVALLDANGDKITVHNTASLKHFAKTVTVGEAGLKRLPAITLPIDYYRVWENGGSITIGGEEYTKAGTGLNGKAVKATSADFNLRTSAYLNGNAAQVLFLEDGGTGNYFGSSAICQVTNPTIVIGRYSDEKVEFRPLMQLRIQSNMLMFKNVWLNLTRIDGSENAGYFITNVGSTVPAADRLVLDDCKLTDVKKQLYYQGSATKSNPISRIAVLNSTIGIGVTTNVQLIYLAESDVLHLFKKFEFNNNIVYNADNGLLQLFCWKYSTVAETSKSTWNAYSWDNVFTVDNNIFFNLPSGSGFITNWQLSSLEIKKNIFCYPQDYAQASYLFGTIGANQDQGSSWLDVTDNVVYGSSTKGFYYALDTASNKSTYKPDANNHTKTNTYPFKSAPDLNNIVFDVVDEYASYGPQK